MALSRCSEMIMLRRNPLAQMGNALSASRNLSLLNGFPYSAEVCFVAYMLVFFHLTKVFTRL